MASRTHNWTVRRATRRVAGFWEIRNGKGVVAIVYTDKHDAILMAASLRMLGSIKHLIAIVRMFEPQLRASAKAKLAQAIALVDELEATP